MAAARLAGGELSVGISAAEIFGLMTLDELHQLFRMLENHAALGPIFDELLEAAQELAFVDRLENVATIVP